MCEHTQTHTHAHTHTHTHTNTHTHISRSTTTHSLNIVSLVGSAVTQGSVDDGHVVSDHCGTTWGGNKIYFGGMPRWDTSWFQPESNAGGWEWDGNHWAISPSSNQFLFVWPFCVFVLVISRSTLARPFHTLSAVIVKVEFKCPLLCSNNCFL
jgi:hypothetical protein